MSKVDEKNKERAKQNFEFWLRMIGLPKDFSFKSFSVEEAAEIIAESTLVLLKKNIHESMPRTPIMAECLEKGIDQEQERIKKSMIDSILSILKNVNSEDYFYHFWVLLSWYVSKKRTTITINIPKEVLLLDTILDWRLLKIAMQSSKRKTTPSIMEKLEELILERLDCELKDVPFGISISKTQEEKYL